MTSWVETTCPPGWAVEWSGKTDSGHAKAMRMALPYEQHYGDLVSGALDSDGYYVRAPTMQAARRLAWERWALEVLGGRLRGVTEQETGFQFLEVSGVGAAWPSDAGPVLCSDASGRLERMGDPVEALARLAALTLAVLGPEVAP